ncbi:ASCH domain-containing protein [Candidatus Daviesbacteria bacterium]|nr:ASCH domain-containing protein [Candidatus Daviesbacteria bacterium]
MKHLAIFKGRGAELILSGAKTIEIRFSKRKDPPYGQISSGDLVFIKPSGEEIIGQFRVKKVIFFDNPGLSDLSNLREKYEKQLAQEGDFWKGKENAKYATLIFIGDSSRFITSPIKIPKKDLRGWVVLN